MKQLATATLLLGLTFAGGCQTTAPQDSQLALQEAPECCVDFTGLNYKVMTADKPGTLRVDREDPAITFENGKSFVEAVALPPLALPYRLRIESFTSYPPGSRKPEVFYPLITLLDADFQPLETLENLPFEYNAAVFGRNRIVMTVTFTGDLAAARYAVIHSSDAQSSMALTKMHSGETIKTDPFESMVYAPVTPARYRINFGPEGRIRLLAYSL
ncbi:MAG: MalM family protein [Pseudomonadota bacterium]|nr:MalM family protein [Pseudomonadota bacterium]